MRKLLILGAGGHGKIIADCAVETGIYNKVAFLDDAKVGETVIGFDVIGKINDFSKFSEEYEEAFVAIGNNKLRVGLMETLIKSGFRIPSLVHPKAHVSKYSFLEYGTVVLAGAVVNVGTNIGIGSIINTCASVDHDCVLGKGVHLSPGARLGGSVIVCDYAWVCIGVSIANNVLIGDNSIIAAGAAVVRNVDENVLVAGVPAIVKKSLNLNY